MVRLQTMDQVSFWFDFLNQGFLKNHYYIDKTGIKETFMTGNHLGYSTSIAGKFMSNVCKFMMLKKGDYFG